MRAESVIDLLKPGEEADKARAYVALESAEASALAAFNFARDISDSDLRLETLQKVFLSWYEDDEAAALKRFKDVEIGEEQIQLWIDHAEN